MSTATDPVEVQEAAERLAAQAPPFTAEQARRLAVLLAPPEEARAA